MNFQDLLLEETVGAVIKVPKTLDKAIEAYQTAYKNKTGRPAPRKDELIIKMMYNGLDSFTRLIENLTIESES